MSDVLDDFDADALQACIDPIEESGVDPHRVDQLRALVEAEWNRRDGGLASAMAILHEYGYFAGPQTPLVDRFLELPARVSPEVVPPARGRSIFRRFFDESPLLRGWRRR